jgi:lycopene beta-cyclase
MALDYVLVGGGLSTALVALAVRARRPQSRIAVIERGEALGGNHTWSFHAADVAPRSWPWLEPLVAHRWDGYDVAFPRLRRELGQPYFSITSESLDAAVRKAVAAGPESFVRTGTEAVAIGARSVRLAGGETLEARVVVDARGPAAEPPRGAGFQKFLGIEARLRRPAPRARPLLMDATVPQIDGFRFLYVLPFAPDRVLLEDTYYSDSPVLDAAAVRERLHAYAAERGYAIADVLREEAGVLPIPWEGGGPAPGDGPLRAGYHGGFYHPTTGYSLPVAARVAEHVASREPEDVFGPELRALARRHAAQSRFCRVLNWLLFAAYPAPARHRVLERFYRLPEATIRRFYALELTAADRLRLLLGRPPAGFSLRAAWSRWQAA